ncbi:MAG: OB-fold domain-containing protein [Burkholderiales bacterium]|nr:OB-fold domain-containing protein [Burkholderiales bacterium]
MNDTTELEVPLPEMTDSSRPFWERLAQGALSFQRCKSCGHAWLPARSECPECLGDDWQREDAAGGATLVSWVVYRHAYHPAFAQRLPYTVAVVQLDEGPRMIANVIGDAARLKIDQRLKLVIEAEGAVSVARFAPA